jgi:CHAT domain-containing protein/tetratricopeptide (TPR) repeat protein
MTQQPGLYDPHIDAFYKALRRRNFDEAATAITELRQGVSDRLQYGLWAEYFAGILAEERERNWAAAEAHYHAVLDQGAEPILRAHVLLSLGIAYNKQARWVESIQACEASAATWGALGYRVRRAIVLRQLAMTYRSGFLAGEFAPDRLRKAANACQEALATFQQQLALPPEMLFYEPDLTLYIAITWDELGNIEMAAGNWASAIQSFQQLSTTWQERGDRYHAAFAYWNLGNAYQLSNAGQWEQAEQLYHQAIAHFREFQDHYFEFNVQASLAALYSRQAQLAAAIASYDQALAMIETVRAGVTSESARSGFFATVVHIYANAVLTLIKAQEINKAFDYVERARARAFLDSLASGATDYTGRIDAKTISLAELQQRLPPHTALLEYYTTGLLHSPGGRLTEQQAATNVLYPPATTLLFVVTRTALAVYDLAFSPNTLLTGDLASSVEELFLPVQRRQALYARLLGPVEPLLRQQKRLYIVPHGPLHYIPFHALIAGDGDTLLRTDGPEIVYGPSATILLRPAPPRPAPAHGSCLAIGYNGEAGRQLRFAEEEAAYIARMAAGTALVGPTSKKAALYGQAIHYQALHFSCHGEFDPDSPLESQLQIGPGETLTGQEIMNHLRLNCQLVTLSACESGLSKVQRGDELYGLIRAFMYAGAPAIIATLWRVDERSTLIFAEKFYQGVQAGLPYATALKAAQLYLKGLSRQAGLEILTQHLVNASGRTGGVSPQLQATHYLKTLLATAEPVDHLAADPLLPGEQADEAIFADPTYWAPFVLIGDPQLQQAGEPTQDAGGRTATPT